jgi:hypothetical protein
MREGRRKRSGVNSVVGSIEIPGGLMVNYGEQEGEYRSVGSCSRWNEHDDQRIYWEQW